MQKCIILRIAKFCTLHNPTSRNALSVGPSVTFLTLSNANTHKFNMREEEEVEEQEEEGEDNNNDDEEEKEEDDNKNKEEEDNKNNKDKGLLTI